jgi:hypothetical protein
MPLSPVKYVKRAWTKGKGEQEYPEPTSEDWKAMVKQCSEDAFDAIVLKHTSTKGKAKGSLRPAWKKFITDNPRETSAQFVIIGIGLTASAVTLAVATGGLAVGLAIGIGCGVWTAKKIKKRLVAWRHNSELASYWEVLNKEETELQDLDLEDGVQAGEAADTSDAARSIRKAVVHLREARRIWKDRKHRERLKLALPGSLFGRVEEPEALNEAAVEEHVKSAQKFRHHLNKFRRYLLPCLMQARVMMKAYEELAAVARTDRENAEDLVDRYFQETDHATCKGERFTGKKHCYRDLRFDGDEDDNFHAVSAEREKAARAKTHTGAGAFSKESLQSIDIDDMDKALDKLLRFYVQRIRKFLEVSTESGDANSEKKLNELIEKYEKKFENPNVYKRFKHMIRNAWRKSTAAEKVLAGVNDTLALGNAVGGVFLTDFLFGAGAHSTGVLAAAVQSENTTRAANWVAVKAVKGAIEGGKGGIQYGVDQGLGYLSNSATRKAVAGRPEYFDREKRLCQIPADSDLKSAASVMDKMFIKMGSHLARALAERESLVASMKKKPEIEFTTCKSVKEFLMPFYGVEYELDKMSRYTVAALNHVLVLACFEERFLRGVDFALEHSLYEGPVVNGLKALYGETTEEQSESGSEEAGNTSESGDGEEYQWVSASPQEEATAESKDVSTGQIIWGNTVIFDSAEKPNSEILDLSSDDSIGSTEDSDGEGSALDIGNNSSVISTYESEGAGSAPDIDSSKEDASSRMETSEEE